MGESGQEEREGATEREREGGREGGGREGGRGEGGRGEGGREGDRDPETQKPMEAQKGKGGERSLPQQVSISRNKSQ